MSIPLIVTGAASSPDPQPLPFLIWAGAALLGWIAGEVIVSDPLIKPLLSAPFDAPFIYAALGTSFVLFAGAIWRSHIEATEQVA
jgi:hypothetical protein